MPRLIVVLLTAGVVVYALVDLLRSRADQVQRLPRLVWGLIIAAFPLFGGLAYLFLGRTDPTIQPTMSGRGRAGPDDDPDFLASLDPHHPPKAPGDESPLR